jgi:hypothetical protein
MRVAARGECAMLQIKQHGCLPVGIRALDAYLPWTVGRRTIGAQIATEIYSRAASNS